MRSRRGFSIGAVGTHQFADPLSATGLTSESERALALAADRREGLPLATLAILKALIELDTVGAWQTIQLRATFIAPGDERFDDGAESLRGTWNGVPLTRACYEALTRGGRIASRYGLTPMPPGVLALGLVWDPACGAARALLEEADLTHAELLDLMQHELLDAGLEGLTPAIAELEPPGPAVPPPAPPGDAVEPVARSPGPFTTTRPGAVRPDDVTRDVGADHAPAPPPRASDLPEVSAALAGRLAVAELLRARATATQAWVFAIDDRVLKIYDLHGLDDREQARILAEASIGMSLGDIEGAVPTLSVIEDNDYLVIEMPRLGASLQEHLDRSSRGLEPRLSPEAYAAALARVGSTLQSMHDRGLVHRHVKPTNLLVEPNTSWLAVSDFAIAHGAVTGGLDESARPARRRRLTRTRDVPGTDRYIAPEQHRGDIGPALDQYALGVTARDALAAPGAPPLTTPVHEVLQRATAPRPADRFPTSGEFGRALIAAVRDEAPRGLAERVAGLTPPVRAALTPALLAVLASIVFAALDVRSGSMGVTLTFLGELLLIGVSAGLVGGAVVAAGAVREQLPWAGAGVAAKPLVPLVASLAVAGVWLSLNPSANTVLVLIATLGGVYGARTLAGPPLGPQTAAAVVATLRRWERRRFMAPARRRALASAVTLLGIATLAAPLIVAVAWPGDLELATEPVGDYGPLTAVWNFRAAAGAMDTEFACKMLTAPPGGASRRAECPDLVRVVGALERIDPITRSATPAFGEKGTFETYRVREIPAPAGVRAWRLLAPGGLDAGSMHTGGPAQDRVTVMVSRLQPATSPSFRSTWLYELVRRGRTWMFEGFRACDTPPGPGRPPAKCVITDLSTAKYVGQLLAATRK